MDTLTLSEHEQKYYAELFSSCDVENTGKMSGVQVSELFLASQLPAETLHQITELCGAKRLGHFGRSQFYIALKLIAAAQYGLPVKFESLNSGIEIPMPTFSRPNEQDKKKQQIVSSQLQPAGDQEILSLDRPNQTIPVTVPSHSNKGHLRVLPNQRSGIFYVEVESTQSGPGNNQPQQITSVSGSGNESPLEGMSPKHTSPSNSPVNNTFHKEQGWASFDINNIEDLPKSWAQFQDHIQNSAAQEMTTEHSSEEEEDIWTITEEQRDYYVNQFKTMQTDLNGLISGVVAKEFFEKSKLPIIELSKIWQLSDVNKDGALSLEEFCTAMHLVVLRRNDIELPDTLPPSLVPRVLGKSADENAINSAPPTSSSPSKLTPLENTSPQNKEWTKFNDSPTSSCKSSPGMKPVNFDFTAVTSDPDSKIIHPVAVRMSPDGPHFIPSDEADAVKLPGVPGFPPPQSSSNHISGSSDSEGQNKQPKTSKTRSNMHVPTVLFHFAHATDHSGKRRSSFPVTTSKLKGNSPASIPALPQGPKKDAPPPPPPRVKKYHARSSSLDLNKVLDKSGLPQLGAPPAVPPRVSPSATTARKLLGQKSESSIGSDPEHFNFADFEQFSKDSRQGLEAAALAGEESTYVGVTQQRISHHRRSGSLDQFAAGAFEVYKKPVNQTQTALISPSAMPMLSPDKDISPQSNKTRVLEDNAQIGDINRNEPDVSEDSKQSSETTHSKSKDEHDIQAAIRSHKERNTMLSRLNCELNQELAEVMEERIALEIQLKHLKPFF